MMVSRLLLLLWALLLPGVVAAGEVWLLVDGESQELQVMRGDRVEAVFHGVSFGRAGVGWKGKQGDDVTPRGRYRVSWINRNSKFRLFLGIDYPRRVDALRGLNAGVIDRGTYDRIMVALERDEVPPQDTALGGYLGIHGLGAGDIAIHSAYNWTQGCIALTNRQIDQLSSWAPRGTTVVIR
jgi:murein L,D-transpeptidase YafK